MLRLALASLLVLAACGKKEEAKAPDEKKPDSTPQKKTYALYPNALEKEPPGGVKVTLDVPADWKEEKLDAMGGPILKPPGTEGSLSEAVSLGLYRCKEGAQEARACTDEWLRMIDEREKPHRSTDVAPGRRWADGTVGVGGKFLDSRLLVFHEGHKMLVSCVVLLKADNQALLEPAKKVCDSLAFP
jgi:hypothetical protein